MGDILIIRCGECRTKFRFTLPEKAPADILLKCTACGTVFAFAVPRSSPPRKQLPKLTDLSLMEMRPGERAARSQEAFPGPAPARSPRHAGLRRVLHFLVIGGLIAGLLAAAGFLWMNPAFFDSCPDPSADPVEKVRIGNLQQRFVLNTGLGRLRIIEGTVTNEAEIPLARIRMLGKLYDEHSILLAVQTASCGRILPDEKLASMSEQDLIAARDGTGPQEAASGRDSERVLPKGQIPFMIVFAGEPAGVTQAYATVISAQRAE